VAVSDTIAGLPYATASTRVVCMVEERLVKHRIASELAKSA
jgi:hypothetical protein